MAGASEGNAAAVKGIYVVGEGFAGPGKGFSTTREARAAHGIRVCNERRGYSFDALPARVTISECTD